MLGTPKCMSPKQYLGETPDGRADLFSAGVLLYELLTGAKPFAGESGGQIMNKILYETPADPSTSILCCRRRWTGWCKER